MTIQPKRKRRSAANTNSTASAKDAPTSITWMDDVIETALTWTWRGYLPDGKLVVLDGDPGLGKSVVWCDLTARISTGDYLPNGEPVETPGRCLIVSAEDDLSDTIKPRLRAAGADMKRIATLALPVDDEGRPVPFTVPDDLQRLEDALAESRAMFVVIDPLMAFVSEHIQSHNDASVRKALTPLADIAQRTGAVILLVRHLNKNTHQTSALHRGGGSIGISGAARSVMLLAPAPDESDDLILAVVKGNLSRGRAPSLRLRVESWEHDRSLPRIRWLGSTDVRADDLLAVPDARRASPERDAAAEFLRELLQSGPMAVADIRQDAKAAGISLSTLNRAAERLELAREVRRDGHGKMIAWTWGLR